MNNMNRTKKSNDQICVEMRYESSHEGTLAIVATAQPALRPLIRGSRGPLKIHNRPRGGQCENAADHAKHVDDRNYKFKMY